MELMIVYMILRKISDLSLSLFYSEVAAQGKENVPRDGPLLLCANHHNEIIDIATLSATIPHRRQVSFWAKSSIFKNPIARFILVSSGSIPVNRNTNSGVKDSSATAARATSESLFAATSRALAGLGPRGGLANHITGVFPDRVVGVFPEGTSYTEPYIMQVKDGAAWAAFDYAKWKAENEAQGASEAGKLTLLPVGIVYTDKSQYLSRVSVKYGKPIPIDHLAQEYIAATSVSDDPQARSVIEKLTAVIRKELLQVTVNGPNWETLYNAELAREILWPGDSLRLDAFAGTSQALVDLFSPSSKINPDLHGRTTASLLRYAGLLHYTGLRHTYLSSIPPSPSKLRATLNLTHQMLVTVLHPRFTLFLPTFILHTPGYLLALLGSWLLADPKLPETIAEFKVIFGGIGLGVSYGMVTYVLARWVVHLGGAQIAPGVGILPVDELLRALARVGLLLGGTEGAWGRMRGVFSMSIILWGSIRLLAKWHKLLVKPNYTQFKHLTAAFKIAAGLLLPASTRLPVNKLDPYLLPPAPALSRFVKYPPTENGDASGKLIFPPRIQRAPRVPAISSLRLILPLLAARRDALRDFAVYAREADQVGVGSEVFGASWGDVKLRAEA